jgi:TonB family protein
MIGKTQKILSYLVTFCVIIISTIATAQKREAKPQAAFDQGAFDISEEKLPPNYLGHAFPAIFAAVARRQVVRKGEYETTEDFNKRLARVKNLPLAGSLHSDSVLAFVVGPVRQDYDADQKTLQLSLMFKLQDGGRFLTTSWSHSEKSIGSYVGRNAFNRAVKVKAYRYDDYLLSIDRGAALKMVSYNGANDTINTSIAIAPLDAQKIRSRIRALLICTLGADGVSSDKSHDPATIDEPYDEYSFSYTMNIIPVAVWFFDSSTGLVLAKTQASNIPIPKKVSPIAIRTSCPPSIVFQPEPHYTEEARSKGIVGTVTLSAILSETGEVTNIVVVKGLPEGLTDRAIEAAKGIKFLPPQTNGKKMPCRMTLEFNFNID